MSEAEFGNYVAGYTGIHYGGYLGFGLVMTGGVAYDIAEHGIYTDFDEKSRPDLEAGAMRALAERDFNLGYCGCRP